jgi:hypothetical protein
MNLMPHLAAGMATGAIREKPISRQHILQGVFEVDSPITFRGCPMPRSQLILH